jgi:hypothetical protein
LDFHIITGLLRVKSHFEGPCTTVCSSVVGELIY